LPPARPGLADALDTLRVAQSLDVWGVVAVGCDAETNARNLALAASAPKGRLGLPRLPSGPGSLTEADLEAVEAQLAEHHSRVVGLGEVGLPWYSLDGKADAAERAARGRAVSTGFWRWPRATTSRSRCTRLTARRPTHWTLCNATVSSAAVFHWHKAPSEVTRRIVDAGYFVSVTPEVAYRERDRALVEQVPLGSLLVESDAPWKYAGEFAGVESGPWLPRAWPRKSPSSSGSRSRTRMFRLTTNACRLFHLAWA